MYKKIIDLTHLLNNAVPVYPGTSSPIFEQINFIEKDGYAEMNLNLRSHTGTHLDAPCHIVPGAKSIEQLPLERFIGKAIVIDCSELDVIGLEFLKSYQHQIENSEFILFYTGWHKKWKSPGYFDEFPILSIGAVEWLCHFNLKGLGFDTISVDQINCQSIPNHKLILEKEVLIIENLNNLEQLINIPFEFNAIPLKLEGADGSPIRAFAKIPEK